MIFFAVAILTLTTTAMAGVIVDQEISSDGPMGATKSKRTLEIQGHKQKVVSSNHSVITDLDNGVMILIDPKGKTYTEMPFPPANFGGHQSPAAFKITFKKTGKERTEKGYKCEEYVGTGHMMMGAYTITGCFASDAPGAKDYTAFDKTLASKLKGTAMETEGDRPVGVPIVLSSVTKMDPSTMPGLTPDRVEAIKKHPNMTSNTETTSVKVSELPADTFTVPSGYTKREMPKQPMPGAHPPVGSSPGAKSLPKVPE